MAFSVGVMDEIKRAGHTLDLRDMGARKTCLDTFFARS